MTRNEAKNLIIRNNAEWVWYETIDKIFDEHGEHLMDRDDEIELLKHRVEELIKPKTCYGCKHKPNDGECYYEPCDTCARFFYDHYELKATT